MDEFVFDLSKVTIILPNQQIFLGFMDKVSREDLNQMQGVVQTSIVIFKDKFFWSQEDTDFQLTPCSRFGLFGPRSDRGISEKRILADNPAPPNRIAASLRALSR